MKYLFLYTSFFLATSVFAQKNTKLATATKEVSAATLKKQIDDTFLANQFDKAILLCDKLLTRLPGDTAEIITKLLCKAKLNKHKETIRDIKKYFKTNAPNFLADFVSEVYPDAFNERMAFNNRELYYTEAYALDIANARIYFDEALDYFDDNDCTKALVIAEKGFRYINESTITFTRTYAFLNNECGDKDKAQNVISGYLKKYPADINALGLKGSFLASQKKYTEAIAHLNDCIARNPNEKTFYLIRVNIYIKMDDKDNACKDATILKEKFNDTVAFDKYKCDN